MRCGTIYTPSLGFCKGHPLINWLYNCKEGATEGENPPLNTLQCCTFTLNNVGLFQGGKMNKWIFKAL